MTTIYYKCCWEKGPKIRTRDSFLDCTFKTIVWCNFFGRITCGKLIHRPLFLSLIFYFLFFSFLFTYLNPKPHFKLITCYVMYSFVVQKKEKKKDRTWKYVNMYYVIAYQMGLKSKKTWIYIASTSLASLPHLSTIPVCHTLNVFISPSYAPF